MTTHGVEEGWNGYVESPNNPGFVGHPPVGQIDSWELGEGSGIQGKATEDHFGKDESQGGSMSPQCACVL